MWEFILEESDVNYSAQQNKAAKRLDDFNAELSGTKSGYTYRTSAVDHENRPDIRAKKARHADANLSALQALLDGDPAYRALYEDTQNKVNEAGARAEAALEKAEAALAEAKQDLAETKGNAARTQEGRLAFKGADGKIYNQNGQVIEGVEADSIVWPSNALTYEEYFTKELAVTESRERVEAWQRYLMVIGEARDRLDEPDNPPSMDELKEIQKRIQEQAPSLRSIPEQETAVEPEDNFTLKMPKL